MFPYSILFVVTLFLFPAITNATPFVGCASTTSCKLSELATNQNAYLEVGGVIFHDWDIYGYGLDKLMIHDPIEFDSSGRKVIGFNFGVTDFSLIGTSDNPWSVSTQGKTVDFYMRFQVTSPFYFAYFDNLGSSGHAQGRNNKFAYIDWTLADDEISAPYAHSINGCGVPPLDDCSAGLVSNYYGGVFSARNDPYVTAGIQIHVGDSTGGNDFVEIAGGQFRLATVPEPHIIGLLFSGFIGLLLTRPCNNLRAQGRIKCKSIA